VNSAGIARYVTWKVAKPVIANRKKTPTHSAAALPSSPAGAAKVRANMGAMIRPPIRSHFARDPVRTMVLSDMLPTTGAMITSQALGRKTTRLATAAATPRMSVR